MTFSKSLLSLSILSCISSFSSIANENETDASLTKIEVITVNNDFREQNLQKTANAITVISQANSELRNAENLEEIVALAPNVNFSSGTQRARYYQIRGIGERSQFQEPINPSVGLMIDDIDFTGIGSIASTFDIAKTEIFRGPQGTRFGANAMAGVIQMTTNQASDDFESTLRLSAGNYNSKGIGLVLSGPATDGVKYRFAAQQYLSDGFINNTFLNRSDTNNRDELSVHGKISVEISKELTLDLAGFFFDFNNGYDAFSLDNNRTTLSDEPGVDNQNTNAYSARLTYTGLQSVDLITILTHSASDLVYGYDEDWSHVGLHPWEYSSTDYYYRDRDINTGELRFSSKDSVRIFNNTTAYTFGFYFKADDEALTRQYTYLTDDFSSSFNTDTKAVYAQFDSQLSKKISLLTGLRLEQRSSDYLNSDNYSDAPTDTMIGGKLVLSYQLNDDQLLYGQISRGYKAGGVNTDGTLPEKLRVFDPEYLVNYEVGYKVNLLNNDAYIRTAAFYMDRHNVQVKSSQNTLRSDGSTEFVTYLGNAAAGFNRGVEIEAGWQVTDQVELYGSLGLLDTEFTDFVNAKGVNLSHRDQAHAPNYQGNIGINIMPDEHWLVNLSVDAKDSYYFSDSHNEKSSPYQTLNATVSYQQDHWKIKAWARNLLNKDYATRGFYFGNDPRDGYTDKQYVQLAEPLVFGLTFDYQIR